MGDFKHGYWVGQGEVGLGVWGGGGYKVCEYIHNINNKISRLYAGDNGWGSG